jgi:MATE family multidrug resistance protein
LHACLDYVAIFVLELGVAGAALANIGSFAIQLSILVFVQREQGLSFGRAEWRAQRRVLAVGAFTGGQWILEIGSLLVLSLFLAGTSDRDMAAHQIGVQVTAFSFLPAFAVAEAATVLVAQGVGRGRFHLVPIVARATIKLAVSYALVCGLVFIAFGPQIVKAFGTDAGLHQLARWVLVAVALQQVFDALTTVGHCVLRGAGAQRRSLLVAILCAWGVTPGMGFLLARQLRWGAPGAWIAMALEMLAASVLVWWHITHLGWVAAAKRAYRAGRMQGHAHA